jgi:hypothetical protein
MAMASTALAGGLVVACGGDDSVFVSGDGGTGNDASTDTTAGNDGGADTGGDTTLPESGGGDTGTDTGGGDATKSDAATDAATDSGTDANDAGQDAGPVCPPDGGVCDCDPVGANTYYVDPVNGSDTLANGSGKSNGIATGLCAFKTVDKAITTVNAIGGGPPLGTKILVLGPSTTAATEVHPWNVPVNTALSSQGGVVTANVPAATIGVHLREVNSSITGFILDGTAHTAANGILVQNTATANTTSIVACTVRDFLDAGIRVEGAAGVTIGSGTRSTGNGVAGAGARPGLRITDTGQVVINNPAGDAISFDANSGYGIEIDLQAKIDLTGTPGATIGTGTVVTNGNQAGGLFIGTSPNVAGPPPLSSFTGLVVYNNAIFGAQIWGATQVRFRGSRFYNNTIGVRLDTSGVSGSDDMSGIDFGKVGDAGKNVLQSPTNMGANSGVGLCIAIQPNKSQAISAIGNTWMGTVGGGAPQQYDCTATAAQLTKSAVTACVGGNGTSFGGTGTNGNTLEASMCTVP